MIERNEHGLAEMTINGRRFEFEKWGTTQSALLLLDVMKVSHLGVGEAIGILFAHDIDTEEVTSSMVAKATSQLLDGLSREPQKTMSIIQKLVCQGVLLEGRKVNFERDFQDDFELLFSVIAAAFEVQYANFSFVSGMIQRYKGVMATPAPAPTSES